MYQGHYRRLPNGFWDRFKKTRTSRLYKGYRIDGDGKRFTVQGNHFDTMKEAQRWVDVEVREEAAHRRFDARETARLLREERKAEREQIRREKEQEREEASAKQKAAASKHRASGESSGGRRHTGASVSSRYHGYRLQKLATGEWTVPQLDPGSRFEDKHEAKRFVDSEVGTSRTINPGWFSRTKDRGKYVVLSGGIPVHSGELSKSEALLMAKEARRAGDRQVRMAKANPKHKRVNLRTLVSAKLKKMPNGTIKVLVSPGAVAKLKAQSSNPSMKNAYIIDETTGKIVKTGMSWAAAYKQAETWTKNSRNKHTYLAMEAKPSGRAPIGKWDGRQ